MFSDSVQRALSTIKMSKLGCLPSLTPVLYSPNNRAASWLESLDLPRILSDVT